MTLVREPRLLLIDEPAVLTRPSEEDQLYALLRELGRDRTLAIVVASEEITAIRRARRMLSIDGGVLRATDKLGELVHFPDRTPARKRSTP